MSEHTPEQVRQLGEASQWLVRLRAEPHSEEMVNTWLRWCEQDSANAEAFERVQRLWGQMDQAFEEIADSMAVVERTSLLASRASRARGWRVAAAFLCVVGAGAVWYALHTRAPDTALNAPMPENRLASLPDGSSIHLAAKTSVAVDFAGTERRIRMSSGEAYFKVRPDKARPFVVRAGTLDVVAVGTAFDVKEIDGRVAVTVQEGIVAVAPIKAIGGWLSTTPWRVGPGYQFVYSERDSSVGLSSVDTSQVLAWREGRLEYVNTPLAQVVSDVNRYARQPIEISDAALGQMTFTGTVFTDSIDEWLQGLPVALPLRLEHTQAGPTLLRPATLGSK